MGHSCSWIAVPGQPVFTRVEKAKVSRGPKAAGGGFFGKLFGGR